MSVDRFRYADLGSNADDRFTIRDMDRAYDSGFEAGVLASRRIAERAARLLDEDLRVQERPTHTREVQA